MFVFISGEKQLQNDQTVFVIVYLAEESFVCYFSDNVSLRTCICFNI